MAHFAKLNSSNVVEKVIVVDNNIPVNGGILGDNDMHIDGETYCNNTFGGTWKQTSYNGAFRQRYATVGGTYDSVNDRFVTAQPYNTWTLNSTTGEWEAPVTLPAEVISAYSTWWDNDIQNWKGTKDGLGVEYTWNATTQAFE